MSYAGAYKLSQISPYRPWPNPPSWHQQKWVCMYCRTETNLFTHRANGGKPCYNCGSTQGEIK